MKKTIAFDLDSVLADVMITWIREFNKKYNLNITKRDITVWDIHTILPITEIESHNLFSYVWKHKWEKIPPTTENIPDILSDLKVENRISIITRREKDTIPYVYEWLKRNGIEYDDLLFIFDDFQKSMYPFQIIIDDNPSNLIDVKFPKVAILYNQPWNNNFKWPKRIDSLNDLERSNILFSERYD